MFSKRLAAAVVRSGGLRDERFCAWLSSTVGLARVLADE